jgi:uridine phosphorylase
VNQEKINPYFRQLDVDYLYHFGLDTSMDLKGIFGIINYVVITRDDNSARLIANRFAKFWYQINEDDFEFKPIFKTERFHLYKIGPVLIVSHGVGMPSMLIALNELAKLLVHTNNEDAQFLKVGPCGGLGLNPGDIVISKSALNSKLEALQYAIECGEEYATATHLDANLIKDVSEFNQQCLKYNVTIGNTIGAWDFYEEQGRMDGFLPINYSIDDRNQYFKHALDAGVISIDMESLQFAAFCNNAGIKACIISEVLVNRLNSDEVNHADASRQIELFDLVTQYILYKINSALLGD